MNSSNPPWHANWRAFCHRMLANMLLGDVRSDERAGLRLELDTLPNAKDCNRSAQAFVLYERDEPLWIAFRATGDYKNKLAVGDEVVTAALMRAGFGPDVKHRVGTRHSLIWRTKEIPLLCGDHEHVYAVRLAK